jgi:small subunit ribosomal protein S9
MIAVDDNNENAGTSAKTLVSGDLAHGVGRRKTAVARVTLKNGLGRITINGREPREYFRRNKLIDEISQPFAVTGTSGKFDAIVAVSGSSLASQAGAVRLAIARSLAAYQPEFRPALAAEALLTRDPRMVERKKYGFRGARRRPQWVKR